MKRRQRLQAQQRMRRLRCRRNAVIPTFTTCELLHIGCQAQQEFSTMCITSGHCPNVRRRFNGSVLVQRETRSPRDHCGKSDSARAVLCASAAGSQ